MVKGPLSQIIHAKRVTNVNHTFSISETGRSTERSKFGRNGMIRQAATLIVLASALVSGMQVQTAWRDPCSPMSDRKPCTSTCVVQLLLARLYLHYVIMPSPIGLHAASNSFGSFYLSPRTMIAQAPRRRRRQWPRSDIEARREKLTTTLHRRVSALSTAGVGFQSGPFHDRPP